MKNSFVLLLSFVAVALGITPAAAKPADIGLNFDLAPSAEPKPVVSEVQESVATAAAPEVKPLDLPDRAAQIPQGNARPRKPNTLAELPPPPPAPPRPTVTASIAPEPEPAQTEAIAPVAIEQTAIAPPDAQSSPPDTQSAAPTPIATPAPSASTQANLDALFAGDENSLVARSVGSAEGTRTPDGGRTWAYRGHTDPGNSAWNLGTFSYQHGADSPEEADRKQLERLNRQAQTLRQHAANQGITLTLEEELNGIDLANQSPRAALSSGGYIDRLRQARDMGLQGSDAVLWARTRAFLDPRTDRWNAPGLGNNVHSITADQDRRRRAIARAIEVQPQIAAVPATAPAEPQIANSPAARREDAGAQPQEAPQEAIANLIISLDLPPS
ncbi:hypothetical protein H6F67_04365 [Microcoleus sp. FACHB-1515]|uniref:hypothetical protein n=1 Tax=Cyanophyceae TaxID=3028117 RepID=UPI001688D839|nr:hypothetical protein [Microcoleus sp. FACHB-1515]MBD2089087.1 hypothetical protein [Microcoleus sp. FACHB-1515]